MKRIIDLFSASIALIFLSPLILILLFLVTVIMGYPPFFTQVRPGKNGVLFRIIKFRTMTDERGPDGILLPNEKRLTKFGAFLRSTSLDEIPELINILKGDMSLVGPRPLLPEYLALYSPEQKRRHDVRPGLTGWAQVNGRNALTWEEKFKLDTWYVDNRSFFLDIKIILKTLLLVIRREGISHQNDVAMPRFKGSK